MKTVVIGCGRVGLPTGLALALTGHSVTFVDVDRVRLAVLASGKTPFIESGQGQALLAVRKRARFTTDLRQALSGGEVAFVTVDTPGGPEERGETGASPFDQAIEALAGAYPTRPSAAEPFAALVVVKSTVSPGTTRAAGDRLRRLRPEIDWHMAANPEFLRQGTALSDALRPARIVIGTESGLARSRLTELYRGIAERKFTWPPFLANPGSAAPAPIMWTSPESAEMAKLAANAFLAARISLINEVANICELVGADVADVVRVVGSDPRLGPHYLQAGLGFGGSCLPKDLDLLVRVAGDAGYDPILAQAVAVVNEGQGKQLLGGLERLLGEEGFRGSKVAVLGLTFKPGTDDVRGSLSLALIRELTSRGAVVRAHDPVVDASVATQLLAPGGPSSSVASAAAAVADADAVFLSTPWPDYIALDWADLARLMRRRIVVDARNALDPEAMRRHGFIYLGVGRGRMPTWPRARPADSLAPPSLSKDAE